MLFYLLFFVFILYYAYQLKRRLKLPPGPVPFHLLGNLPQLGFYVWNEGSLPKALQKFHEHHGDIFTIWMGPLPTVHIASMELAHELMVKQGNNFADRWAPLLFRYVNKGLGISMSNGNYWQEQRRFALQTLRNFGLGRNLIEERIMLEFDLQCSELEERRQSMNDDVVDIKKFFELMIANIMNRLLFSERFTKDSEEEFFVLKNKFEETMENLGFLDIYVNEWMLKAPFMKSRYDKLLQPVEEQSDFIHGKILERLEAIRQGEHVITDEGTDFVDAYLKKIDDEKDNPHTSFTQESLNMTLLDLWAAGQETTTTVLLWAFIYFLHNSEVYQEASQEIQKVTQRSRALSLKDRTETPYFNATITEVLRQASIVTMNSFRLPKTDCTIGTYTIGSDVPITAQISLIMSDERYFGRTEQFRPERFSEDKKLEPRVIPFGIGKRACPGESLARAELYLIIGNILNKFEVEASGDCPIIDSTNRSGIVRKPEDYNVKLIPRYVLA
ncbi:unnamed protein product [Auanema sp. JU1783]|nr:unnamed protein product [Auanema sp. JU1783]